MKSPKFWALGWPLIDRGDPCFWPLFDMRVRLVRKFPSLYPLVWWDWR